MALPFGPVAAPCLPLPLGMAGAVVRPGTVHGATDDFSCNVVKDPVPIHDLDATTLHPRGIDHTKLTCRLAGRDSPTCRLTDGLTDVHGRGVSEILP